MIWLIALAMAEPQDLDMVDILVEVQRRQGHTERDLNRKIAHAAELAATPGIPPAQQAAARGLECAYRSQHAAVYGGPVCDGSETATDVRRHAQSELEPRYSAYRQALAFAYSWDWAAALQVLPSARPPPTDTATHDAVLDDEIEALRGYIADAQAAIKPGCVAPTPWVVSERARVAALSPHERHAELLRQTEVYAANIGRRGLGGRGLTVEQQNAAVSQGAAARTQMVLLGADNAAELTVHAESLGQPVLGGGAPGAWALEAGRAVQLDGRDADAVVFYQRAARFDDPARRDALQGLGDAWMALGQDAQACAAYTLAGSMEPTDPAP